MNEFITKTINLKPKDLDGKKEEIFSISKKHMSFMSLFFDVFPMREDTLKKQILSGIL